MLAETVNSETRCRPVAILEGGWGSGLLFGEPRHPCLNLLSSTDAPARPQLLGAGMGLTV
jgi:hypothetical protein